MGSQEKFLIALALIGVAGGVLLAGEMNGSGFGGAQAALSVDPAELNRHPRGPLHGLLGNQLLWTGARAGPWTVRASTALPMARSQKASCIWNTAWGRGGAWVGRWLSAILDRR